MTTARTIRTTLTAVFGAAFLAAAPAGAQDVPARPMTATAAPVQDAGWLPLVGCWVPAGQSAEEGLLCVRPLSGAPGVELVSVADGETSVARTIVTDGRSRPVAHEGCEGMEQAELSLDGDRLYLRSELVCEGGVRRTSTGVISFPSPHQWLDVEAVEVDGRSAAWAQWYTEAPDGAVREAGMEALVADREMAVRSARLAASGRLTADDVVEATRRVDVEAVRALVAQRAEPFELDAETLVRLADAGVAEDVIDVMVAVTYPETFAFDGEDAAPARPSGRVQQAYVDPFYSPYGYYRSYRRGFYSPWGYWGGSYPWYGGYSPVVVVVEPRSSEHGRVVPGRGYSRGSASSGGSAQPRDRAAGATRRAGSSGGTVSPAATRSGSGSASSGSSGSSTGRKAKPRGGGGGGSGGGG